jgi:hypothetical protein
VRAASSAVGALIAGIAAGASVLLPDGTSPGTHSWAYKASIGITSINVYARGLLYGPLAPCYGIGVAMMAKVLVRQQITSAKKLQRDFSVV